MVHHELRCHSHIRALLLTIACTLTACAGSYAEDAAAVDGTPIHDGRVAPTLCRQCGCKPCECELVCHPEKVPVTETRTFWKVTCEYVCIPGFRFPWECKKDHSGRDCLVSGTVRAVNMLTREEYECDVCGYEWEVTCVCRCGEGHRASDCQCPRCAEGEHKARIAKAGTIRK